MLTLDEEQEMFLRELYTLESIPQPKGMKRRLLSLFSGGGGMDLGFEGGFNVKACCLNKRLHPSWIPATSATSTEIASAEWLKVPETHFETVFANDIEPAAARAWRYYFGTKHTVDGRYHTASIVDLVKRYKQGTFSFPSDIDVVTGGFPCNDFSVSGKRKGFDSHRLHDGTLRTGEEELESRGKLYLWMKQIVEITKPKVFVAENVKGLVSLANVKQIIEDDFRHISGGYIVVPAKVLYAPDYGIPQTRERVIFIGLKRESLRPEALVALTSSLIPSEYDLYPPKTHGKYETSLLKSYVSVGEVLSDLPEPTESLDLSQMSYSKAKYMGVHCQGQKEVDLRAPGPTIRAEHHGNIEYRRLSKEHKGQCEEELAKGLCERRLTVRECARIQTFPDDYSFVIDKPESEKICWFDDHALSSRASYLNATAGYRVIGNAVPPLLGYHIAKRLEVLWPKLFNED